MLLSDFALHGVSSLKKFDLFLFRHAHDHFQIAATIILFGVQDNGLKEFTPESFK